jgi:predicted cupin superfamily sugar epimerase
VATAHGLTAADIIRLLGLEPHPEGGHYRQTFRDRVESAGRAASTAIYYLLARGERSRWHRVDAAEAWHHYAGAPLELEISPDGRHRWSASASASILRPASARRPSSPPVPGRPP